MSTNNTNKTSSTPFFDVVASDGSGSHKLGRAWMHNKDGKFRMTFELSSMPLPTHDVHLVSKEHQGDWYPDAFILMSPIERDGKKTYWHPVGQVNKKSGDEGRAFELAFQSIPLAGNLAAFAEGN